MDDGDIRGQDSSGDLPQSAGAFEFAPDSRPTLVDANGTIDPASRHREELVGYPHTQPPGLKSGMPHPGPFALRDDGAEVRESIVFSILDSSKGQGLEHYGQFSNGEQFPIEISLSPLHAEDGLLESRAFRAITARKQVEATLRTSPEEKDTWFRAADPRAQNSQALIARTFFCNPPVSLINR
jgi:hypothetical protein